MLPKDAMSAFYQHLRVLLLQSNMHLHQRMWKAYFDTVDGAIAGCFDYCEEGSKVRVENNAVNCLLCGIISQGAYLRHSSI